MRTPQPVPTSLQGVTGFYRLTVEQYQLMVRAGVFGDFAPCELLEGYLVNSPYPFSPFVCTTRMRLYDAFRSRKRPGWLALMSYALTLTDSEPEVDFVLARGDRDEYSQRLPVASEVGIVGEVSDTSLVFDRGEKGRIYASAGLPVYWIVNVADKQIEVYTGPTATGGYANRADYKPGDSVPITLDGTAASAIAVSEIIV